MKNTITRLTISLFVFGTTLSVLGAQLDVQAFIDGRSDLVIQGNNVWWHHHDGAAPGRWAGVNEPTYVNSISPRWFPFSWFPDWPQLDENTDCICDSSVYDQLSPPLGVDGSLISVDIISAQGSVAIVQQPSQNNGFTAIVEFDDSQFSGAAWYEVIISYTSVGPLPPYIYGPEYGFLFLCGYGGYATVHVADPDSDTLTVTASTVGSVFYGGGTVTGTLGAGVDVTFFVGDLRLEGEGWILFSVSDEQNTVDLLVNYIVIANPLPTIQCPADVTVQAGPGQTSAIVNFPPPTASTPCGNRLLAVFSEPPSGFDFPIGTTTVLCTAGYYSPAPGESPEAHCTFNVTVAAFDPCANDSQAPQASCLALKPSRFFPNPPRIVGHFQLQAADDCDSDPLIYVGSARTSFVAGPFHNGDNVEITHAQGLTPGSHPGGPPNVAAIQLNGDVQIWAVDSSGNASAKQICR